MKLNGFLEKLTRNAPDNPGGSPAGQEGVEPKVVEPEGVEGAAPDYGWMPEEYRSGDAPDFEGFKAHYQDLIADQARRAEETAIPDSYDFALPEGFDYGVELPEGVSVGLDADSPLLAEFGGFLKEKGMSQDVATGLMGLLARYQAQEYAAQHSAATKEFETLGATDAARNARVSSVQRALETRLPQDQAQALMDAIRSAAGVKALEAILKPRGGTSPASVAKGAEVDGLSGFALLKRANELKMQQ